MRDGLDRLLAKSNPVHVDELPDAQSPAAVALYARLAREVDAARRPRSRVALLAAAVALLLIAGGAVAAVAVGPWWEDGEPPVNPEVVARQLTPHEGGFPPAADRTRARTVARDDGAALVAAPVGESGYCLIPSLPGSADIGVSCTYQVKKPASGASDEFRSYARPPADGEPRWILYGRITDSRARVLDLSEAAGVPLRVELTSGGFFLANVPKERWPALANTAGSGRILDAEGDILRTGCVNWGPSPHSRGAGGGRPGFWSEGAGPCRARPLPTRPTPLFEQADKLVEMTLREKSGIWEAGTKIAVWRTPTREGGECLYVASATSPGGQIRGLPVLPGGGVCRLDGPVPAPAQPLTAQPSWSSEGRDGYSVVINGQVKAAERTTRVVLRTPAREEELPYGNGFYLAQLPNSAASGRLPPGGPYTVVAYDAHGREVARLDLADWLRKLRSPGG
jgi:hypothetical protein